MISLAPELILRYGVDLEHLSVDNYVACSNYFAAIRSAIQANKRL